MKLALIIFLNFICAWSWAGPGDGPIVPWPSATLREELTIKDIVGSWMGYANNSVWTFDILECPEKPRHYELRVHSHSLFTNRASGLLVEEDRLVTGTLSMDPRHMATFLIFRDHEGTKFRINNHDGQHLDIKIYPIEDLPHRPIRKSTSRDSDQ